MECPELKSWFDAFDQLKVLVKKSPDERKVIFLDEVPWMGRSDASFISAVENFWNAWASAGMVDASAGSELVVPESSGL